jgi:hypothetical protein
LAHVPRGKCGAQAPTASEEEVPLVSFAFCSAVSSEAHFFGIVGAEFVTKELPAWGTPWLQLSINDR